MSDEQRDTPVLPPGEVNPQRKLDEWRRKAEEAIQEAQDQGLFDNLPGQGEPLVWDTDHDGEHWLAQHMLKSAGYVPAWIDDAKWIAKERGALHETLERLSRDPSPSERRIADWREKAEALNQRIDTFNLSVPLDRLQVPRLRVETLMAEALGGSAA